MLTVLRSLDELIDDTLQEVARYDERGYRVQLDTSGLPDATSTTCSLVSGDRVQISDVIEFGDELVLVTDKTAAVIPVFTVARGYDSTVAGAHAASSIGTTNPQFARRRVGRVVQTALTRMDAGRVFVTHSGTFFRNPSLEYVELPEATRDVLRVGYLDPTTGRFERTVDGWEFFDDFPVASVASGKLIRLPRYLSDTDSLIVTYRVPYRWSSWPVAPTGSATIELPEGAEDLPSMYASARLCSRREMSRTDIDRSEEWSKSQSVVQGVTSGLIRQMWSEWYKALSEAATLNVQAIPRPFVRLRRFL